MAQLLVTQIGAYAGISALSLLVVGGANASPLDPLDPTRIPKYVDPLVIPPAMPKSGFAIGKGGIADYYEIAVRQFSQRILPAMDVDGGPLAATTVWGYGSANHPATFNYPSFTIEARVGKPVRVKWINDLKDPGTGEYLPHLLAIDPTLHWANPPGGLSQRDTRPTFTATPGPYTGPVPMITHVHGAETYDDSDGYAEAWYLPDATNIPAGYARVGTWYDGFSVSASKRQGSMWSPGSAVFDYPNEQRATTLWYHDHTLGMTRANVYAGPAGFYLLRGGPDEENGSHLPGPAPGVSDPPGTRYYEIPLAIQDRTFRENGQLFYPESREFFDGVAGPYWPDTDVSPIWNPEFFGTTMVVNGKTWPYLDVERRRYRFRILNGCNSRFLILELGAPGLDFWQIGAEGGFLKSPVRLQRLLMAPAERADVIVDFSNMPVGAEVVLKNLGPDEPFGGGVPGVDFAVADPASTGQVMKFRVRASSGRDATARPNQLKLPKFKPIEPATTVRQLALLEMMSMDFPGAPAAAMLGTMMGGMPMHKMWADPITEDPFVGRPEVWEIYNFTADAHPIHIHQVQFQVVDRQALDLDLSGEVTLPAMPIGTPWSPEPWESAFKDTVIAYPGQVTRLRVRFDLPGLFVWHCHIVEHEDNEMMRPLRVQP